MGKSADHVTEEAFDTEAHLSRALEGDEDAVRSLMNHLYPLIMKMVATRTPRRVARDDLIQTIFIKVFARLPSYAGKVPLRHWVSRIAINTCVDQLRREASRPELRMADLTEEQSVMVRRLWASDAELHPDQDLAARELVDEMLARLKPADQLLARLIFLEGHSYEEARRLTGWNMPLIKVRLHRLRHKMRKILHQLMPENHHETARFKTIDTVPGGCPGPLGSDVRTCPVPD